MDLDEDLVNACAPMVIHFCQVCSPPVDEDLRARISFKMKKDLGGLMIQNIIREVSILLFEMNASKNHFSFQILLNCCEAIIKR